MQLQYADALKILEKSSLLYAQPEIDRCILNIANQLKHDIGNDIPLFLTIMNGGMFFAVNLLQHLDIPCQSDYAHLSRYGNDKITGSAHCVWHRAPKLEDLNAKHVYIIDDILDEGHTLAEVKNFVLGAGAKSCKIIVLVDKDLGKEKPITADYVGISVPNKYLFGYGMDIFGLYRQLPNLYVYNE